MHRLRRVAGVVPAGSALGRPVFPGRYVQLDGTPSRTRQVLNLLQYLRRPPPQGNEGDAHLVQARQAVERGQAGIEDQVAGQFPMRLLPEGDKAKDFFGFLAFTNVGVRVAERVRLGVLGKEGQPDWVDCGCAPRRNGAR